MQELDIIDRKIMYELDLNARISSSQLARKLRKSKETTNFRLRRLMEKGYLKGFFTVFNTSKLGWFYVKVYTKFKDTTPQKEKEIFEYLRKRDHVAYLASIEGRYDCIFLVMVRNMAQMDGFLVQFMNLYGDFVQEKDICVFLTTHRLNQKFLYEGTTRADWHYPYELGDYKLDAIDKKILGVLSTNARAPLVEIAEKLALNVQTIKYRLKKLEKDGIILAYASSPNFDKLGLQFVQINISLKDLTARKSIMEYFDATNKCLFAIELLGKFDVLAEIHVKDNLELKSIVDGFREKFVGRYTDYDVSTITKEYVMVWSPFGKN
ncbi:MAG: Lrp/AsnC family transcriptional regulator [Candidatus Micrarchaeota archaeon]|nr:Lrp/AsnC family transcriptional regulator [Candidatus Micrarchaeota archaeon]